MSNIFICIEFMTLNIDYPPTADHRIGIAVGAGVAVGVIICVIGIIYRVCRKKREITYFPLMWIYQCI